MRVNFQDQFNQMFNTVLGAKRIKDIADAEKKNNEMAQRHLAVEESRANSYQINAESRKRHVDLMEKAYADRMASRNAKAAMKSEQKAQATESALNNYASKLEDAEAARDAKTWAKAQKVAQTGYFKEGSGKAPTQGKFSFLDDESPVRLIKKGTVNNGK